jgi:cell fate regulator YaaT (PSP1 superfamily)
MGCCEGSCRCGKDGEKTVHQDIHLVHHAAIKDRPSMHDFLKGLNNLVMEEELVEIRFKGNRREFFRNVIRESFEKHDRVVVERGRGYDLGTVTMTGELARKQFEAKGDPLNKNSLKRVVRGASQKDLETWLEAKKRERVVLLRARSLVAETMPGISITDVEFRGDGKKAVLYYRSPFPTEPDSLALRFSAATGTEIECLQQS